MLRNVTTPKTLRALSVAQTAERYGVARAKVRAWIRSGQLRGVYVDDISCRRRMVRIPPEALMEFERVRSTVPLPKVTRQRRTVTKDYYPD